MKSFLFVVVTLFMLANIITGLNYIIVLRGEASTEVFLHSISDNDDSNKTKNLSQNLEDSVYAQVSTSGDNVYVAWQESVGSQKGDYDIFFIVSRDGGASFSSPINLSNNTGFSEHPQISASGNNVYIIWVDDNNTRNKQVLLRKSYDSGSTFEPVSQLSKDGRDSFNAEIDTYKSNVYVVWNDFQVNKGNNIMFVESKDNGVTFEGAKEFEPADEYSYPKIGTFGDNTYVVWNARNDSLVGEIFFDKIANEVRDSSSVDKKIIASYVVDGESKVSTWYNKIFVFWTAGNSNNSTQIYNSKSGGNGEEFTKKQVISKNFTDSSNVESVIRNNELFVTWQADNSGNQEILLTRSRDGGITFDKIMNLSNNDGTSECPSIAISKNKLHLVWEDDTLGNHEVFYKSINYTDDL
jgi:hypothetical protein